MDDQRFHTRKIVPFLFCGALFVSGCATVNLASIGQDGYKVEDDEQRIFNRVEESQEILDESGYIYPNADLEGYMTRLANQLCPKEVKEAGIDFKVKVLEDPSFNAFAFPNGRIYVHTGMLALMDNESQLATMMGHEMAHVINRHALKQFRSLTNKSAFLSTMIMPAAIAGGQLGSIFIQMTVISSVYGYSQSQEFEADRLGFAMLEQNGYDTRESVVLFDHLDQYLKDEKIKSPLFFSSHPQVRARKKNYEKFIKRSTVSPEGKKINSPEFNRLTHTLVLDNAKLCLQKGMFLTAQKNIEKYIAQNAQDPQGHYWLGELYRQRQDKRKGEKVRDKKEDYTQALEAYTQATSLDNRFAFGYRGQGQIYRKLNKDGEAKAAYQKYLRLQPEAKDKLYIQNYLDGIEK